MSELFDKEVNAKREFDKTSRVHASSQKPMKKCALKLNNRNKEKYVRVKKLLMEGSAI